MSFITPEGRTRLERVATWLEAGAPHVVEHNIGEFNIKVGVSFLTEEENEKALENPTCGSICCIAGAVCQFEDTFNAASSGLNLTTLNGREVGEVSWRSVQSQAEDLLGISEEDADKLFLPPYFETRTYTAQCAAKVIRNFLATGDVVWSLADE